MVVNSKIHIITMLPCNLVKTGDRGGGTAFTVLVLTVGEDGKLRGGDQDYSSTQHEHCIPKSQKTWATHFSIRTL